MLPLPMWLTTSCASKSLAALAASMLTHKQQDQIAARAEAAACSSIPAANRLAHAAPELGSELRRK